GLWLGIIICSITQSLCFLGFIGRLNWKNACEEAQIHANLRLNMVQDEPAAACQDTGGPRNRGGISVKDVRRKHETQLDQQRHQEDEVQAQPRDTTDWIGKHLVLWRGFLLLGVILVLIVGILVRVYVRVE
ncbi:unnamed protein product, partial [Gulo gulo]